MKRIVLCTLLFAGITLFSTAQSMEDVKKYKSKKTYGYFELYFGWNNWYGSDGMADIVEGDPTTTELDFWPSMNWGFGFGSNTRFGESKFSVRYGLQFNWHFFRLKGNTILVKSPDPEGVFFVQDETQNYKKSSFRKTYLDLPVLLQFHSKGASSSGGFVITAGGYIGLSLATSTKLCFTDEFNDQVKVKYHDNFFTNAFRYGVMAQLGWGSFRITGKLDLNQLWEDDKETPDYQIGGFTLGWVFP
jgi:hypothetical protein